MTTRMLIHLIAASLCVLGFARPAAAIDAEDRELARATIDRAIAYLREHQDAESGAWHHDIEGMPEFPAVTGLVIRGMLLDPRIDERDPAVARGVRYLLDHRQPDGGIYIDALPNYNTAISLSALALVHDPEAASAVHAGQDLLRSVQFYEGSTGGPEAPAFNEPITPEHPYYGGVGYGNHSRPDLSNTAIMLQALHDTGVSAEDPAVQRALVFLSRLQMSDEVNEMPYADGSTQGGFIYATTPDAESIDGSPGHSSAGEITETAPDGSRITRHRAYGAMTYAGFKSLIYADLPRDDPRLVDAKRWIDANFTTAENPGMGEQGYYYYVITLARALEAWGEPEIAGVDWRTELIHALAELQDEDGSFRPLHARWMEHDRVLITAYALNALQHAVQ